MLATENAINLIYASLEEINSSRPPDAKIPLNHDTKLLGDDGLLDSLDVVEVVVSLERQLSRQLGRKVVLLDEEIVTHDSSPLQDVTSLAEFLSQMF